MQKNERSLLFLIMIFTTSCHSEKTMEQDAVAEKNAIVYTIDTTKWFAQDPEQVVAYMEMAMNQKPGFTADQIVEFSSNCR